MVYISGKISGLSKNEYENNFFNAEKKLVEKGYKVINPVRISRTLPKNPKWSDYMRVDIVELMKCDTIYMLSNWLQSPGAEIERNLAIALGYTIIYEKN